jgi:hypothetical protein
MRSSGVFPSGVPGKRLSLAVVEGNATLLDLQLFSSCCEAKPQWLSGSFLKKKPHCSIQRLRKNWRTAVKTPQESGNRRNRAEVVKALVALSCALAVAQVRITAPEMKA